jgi:hypothetical protein
MHPRLCIERKDLKNDLCLSLIASRIISGIRQLWMLRPGLPVDKSYRVSNDEVKIPQIHRVAGIAEPKRDANWNARSRVRYFFVRTLYMFKMVREDIDDFKVVRFPAPQRT